MLTAKSIRDALEEAADVAVFVRGMRYAASGRVLAITEERRDVSVEIEASVRGSRTYHSYLSLDEQYNEIENYECTCPYDDGMCKHVVALGLVYADKLEAAEILPINKDDGASEAAAMRAKLEAAGIPAVHIPDALLADLIEVTRAARPAPKQPEKTWQHTGRVWTPIDAAEEKKKVVPKPPPKKPFHERYDLSIITHFDGTIGNAKLKKRNQKRQWYYAPSIRAEQLLKEDRNLTQAEHDLLSQLATEEAAYKRPHEDRDDTLDYPRLLQSAREAHIRITHDAYSGNKTVLQWREAKTLQAKLSLEERSSDLYSLQSSHVYSAISLQLPRFNRVRDAGASVGEDGVLIIAGGEAEIHAMPALLGRLVERAVRGAHVDPYAPPHTPRKALAKADLLDEEYEHVNQIIDAVRAHLNADIELAGTYEIKRHEPQGVVVVDYREQDAKLSVLPSVDYGVVVLPVSQTMQLSPKAPGGMRRRQEGAFGNTRVVRIDGSTIHIAPVAEQLERTLFDLGSSDKRDRLGISRSGRVILRGRQITPFIERFLPEIKKLPYEVQYPHDKVQEITKADVRAEFDIDFNAENDWLAFDLALYCGDARITLADIEAFLEAGGDLLKTKDGRVFKIANPEAIERLMRILEHFRKNADGSFEGRAYHAPALAADAAGSPHYSARLSKSFRSFTEEAQRGRALKRLAIPRPFSGILRTYQKEGVEWMAFLRRYRFGGILADDMGTGKTLQALTALSMHRQDGLPSLVIAPKTLLHNWEREAALFAPHLKTAVVAGSPAERAALLSRAGEYDLLITSYPLLQKDLPQYEAQQFNYCVLDEAQYVKNPRTRGAHAVKKVRSEYRLALTGTPLENSVEELWSIFDFLMPDFLGRHAHFQRRFGAPIMKRGDAEVLTRLRSRIACFMLRRTKEEVLKELPAKIEQTMECTLSDEQNILYQEVLARVRSDIFGEVKKKGFASSQIHILAGLTKLRQICNHPALVLKKKRGAPYPSAKMDVCLDLVEELRAEGRKVLIFSQFTQMLDIIAVEFAKRKIGYAYLSGATTMKRRPEIIDSFTKDAGTTAFLISTKAGGVGLNLVAADAVIIFDPWWNPQVERQAIDRAHRIGQTKTVNVYRLRTRGTIEEKIASLQERKQKLFGSLVGESKDAFTKLTWDDVRRLLADS